MASRGFDVHAMLLKLKKATIYFAVLEAVLRKCPVAVRADSLCEALIFPLGYACNEYSVETSDGFILGVYNIPYGRAGPAASPGVPVLLFHGFQAGGDNFVANNAEESLGTVLADAGFDVWIGNNRNLQWSHGSSKYSEDDPEYWDWTWDELAIYDVPTILDFVYQQRGSTKVFFVGHSQGTLIFFAALTNSAALSAHIAPQLRGAVLIAPFAYNSDVQAPLLLAVVDTGADEVLPAIGIGPVNIYSLFYAICVKSPPICTDLIYGSLGTNSYLNMTRRFFYLKYFPQVTSSKNFNHFGQTKRDGAFQKYDRGSKQNLIKYGQDTPPFYDWSLFPDTFPIQIISGGRDQLATPNAVEETLSKLPPNSVKDKIVLPDYGHVDFILGYRASSDLYPQLVSFLNRN